MQRRWLVWALLGLGCSATSANPPTRDTGVETTQDVVAVVDTGSDTGPVDAGVVVPEDVPTTPPTDTGNVATSPLITARPYGSLAPTGYNASRTWPMILVLHGYGATGAAQSFYLGMQRLANAQGILLAYPDGTVDGVNRRFWNASGACCDFYRRNIDDVAYLTAVLDDMAARYRVDPRRVFVVGHSNGGFMAHRLACAIPGRIAAIASLAGAVGGAGDYACDATTSMNVVQIHGTMDATIRYEGGSVGVPGAANYPSAQTTAQTWATRNGCGAFEPVSTRLNIDTTLSGDETAVTRATGCQRGAVELWTIADGVHIPTLGASFGDSVWAFFSRVTAR